MEPVITLMFAPNEVNTVIAALSELPYKTSAALIHRIAADTNRQLTPPPEDGEKPLPTNE